MEDDRRTENDRLTDGPRTRGTGQPADDLRNVRGAVYLPQRDWNAYQHWANYDDAVTERDLGYAAALDLNSLRVFASYEYWREDGSAFFAHVERFLAACESRSIRPLVVLFEAPPKAPPTPANLRATDPENAFGVHSPSRPKVIGPRNWKGYARSPIHFARRWAQEFAEDDRLLATEIMNEPGKVQPRRDFVLDALRTVRTEAPNATLTMGTKDVRFARFYDDPDALDGLRGLDAYQFHMNLPATREAAREYATEQRALADEIGAEVAGGDARKPLWCTEWQRTLEEPPSRFAPNLASLAPTIRDLHGESATDPEATDREATDDRGAIDGDFFWSLMLRPAYLRVPRENGRFNGLFHPDGTVYSRLDAEGIAGRPLDRSGRRALPSSWAAHSFPYPGATSGAFDEKSARDGPSEAVRVDESANRGSKSDGIGRRRNTEGRRNDERQTDALTEFGESLYDRLRRALGLTSEDGRENER